MEGVSNLSLFTGSGVALVTPFKNNQVDWQMFEYLINWHINENTDAIIVCGTTGEASTLSKDEKKKIYEVAVKEAKKRVPIIAGTGTNSTSDTLELSVYAQNVGCDGVLIVTPYYNKPSQAGLIAHYETIAQAINIPIILYNVPSRTGVNLLPETICKLAKIPNIVAIKEASGDISQIAKISELCKQLTIYAGNDDQLIPIMALGGKGIISVTANIIPNEIHDLVSEYLYGNHHIALLKFLRLRKLNQALFIETNPVPIKTALNLMGLEVGKCRLPLIDLEPENLAILKNTLTEYGLIK